MKYYVDYMDSSGDLNHTWCEANSPEEAEGYTKSKYWDIDNIIQIYTKK